MIDRICVKVQDHLNSLKFTETNLVQEDMKVAENLMKDARNSKTVRRHEEDTVSFKQLSSLSSLRYKTLFCPPAAPQPVPSEEWRLQRTMCRSHSGQTGVDGWRSGQSDGRAAAGIVLASTQQPCHQTGVKCFHRMD